MSKNHKYGIGTEFLDFYKHPLKVVGISKGKINHYKCRFLEPKLDKKFGIVFREQWCLEGKMTTYVITKAVKR